MDGATAGRRRRSACSPVGGCKADQMAERGPGGCDRWGGGGRDHLVAGPPGERSATAGSAGRRAHPAGRERVIPTRCRGTDIATSCPETRSPAAPNDRGGEAPGGGATAPGARAPAAGGVAPAPAAPRPQNRTNAGRALPACLHPAAGLPVRPAPVFGRIPHRALARDLGRRALRADIAQLLIHPIARVALHDDLLEALRPQRPFFRFHG